MSKHKKSKHHSFKDFPSVKHKGDIKPPFSHSLIAKMVSTLLPPEDGLPSNEGSNLLGEVIYMLFIGLFGRSVHTTEYAYLNSLEGQTMFDAGKIIRILMYFFSNTFISIFFKDIELMYLNENHNIDDEFFDLGITLRQIHNSITNGLISFIFSIASNQEMIGGGTISDIDLNEIVKTIFIDLSFNKFKTLLSMGPKDLDPYDLRVKTTKKELWDKSFTKMLMDSKDHKKKTKSKPPKLDVNNLKGKIKELSHIKDKEINEIIEILEGKKKETTESYSEAKIDDMLIGGSQSQKQKKETFAYPGNEGTDIEENKDGNNKYFFYKLFLLESLFNSDKFLESFEVMFNLMCRLINRLIKRIIPLIRNLTSKTINNVAAFVFSLGGPFTEIFWFVFSSLLTVGSAGMTALNVADDLSSGLPSRDEYGKISFGESSILKSSETEPINELVSLLENINNNNPLKGGGKKSKVLSKFDRQIKECLDDFFSN